MRYILKESQYKFLLEGLEYDPNVEKIQKILISRGYDLGSYGPNHNGVDGKFGPLTKNAFVKEFGMNYNKSQVDSKNLGGGFDAVLVGGLDNRSGDLDISSQVSLFKQGFGSDKNIKGFRFNTPTQTVEDFINSNPNIPVYLFSAGCKKAYDIARAMGENKNKLFIIEPFAAGTETKNNVRSAVSLGVPSSNVFVGDSVGRGLGIVNGTSSSKSSSHWNALKTVGSMTK